MDSIAVAYGCRVSVSVEMSQGWRSLSDFVREMRPKIAAIPEMEPRRRADLLAFEAFGQDFVMQNPAAVNVAALAMQHEKRMVVHEMEVGVRRLVDGTDLRSLPSEPPRLLLTPWMIEVKEPTRERIFGDTASLGGYELDGSLFLVGLNYPDGIQVARWEPKWCGGEIEEGVAHETNTALIDDIDAHDRWARSAARFAVVFGLLLDVASSPLRVIEPKPKHIGKRARRNGAKVRPSTVVTRRVILDAVRAFAVAKDGATSTSRGELQTNVPVRGHLKRQPFGPANRDRKWIWVEGYSARRWVGPELRVTVGTLDAD